MMCAELVREGLGAQLVVKTSVMEEQIDEWPRAIQRKAQTLHSGTIWLSEEGIPRVGVYEIITVC